MYAIYMLLPRRRRYRRRRAGDRGRPAPRRWRRGARDIDSLYAGRRAGPRGLLSRAGAGASACDRADFLAVIDGMAMDVERRHSLARPRDARSLLRPRRRRPSGACRSRSSAWTRSPALRSPIISAGRCSSPISCATWTRMPAIGRVYLPREHLEKAGIAIDRAGRRHRRPAASTRACRALGGDGARALSGGRSADATAPAGSLLAPRLMAAAYGTLLRADGGRRLGAAAPARPRQQACLLTSLSAASLFR